VSGEHHASAVLPEGVEPLSPIEYKAASAPELLCILFRRMLCLNLPRIEPIIPGRSARSLVRVLRELSRVLFVYWCSGYVTGVAVLAMLRWLVCMPCYDGWCACHVAMVGVMTMLRRLVHWPGYDSWCTGHVTTVGVLAMLRRLVLWPCYDGWSNGQVMTVGVMTKLRRLVYWPCYEGWCTGQVTTVDVTTTLRWLV
jgi:hypothetical protein